LTVSLPHGVLAQTSTETQVSDSQQQKLQMIEKSWKLDANNWVFLEFLW
jgi:hypothetical protein